MIKFSERHELKISIFKQAIQSMQVGYGSLVFIQVENKIQKLFSPECRSVPG